MKKILVSWIGKHDLNAAKTEELGPVLAAIKHALRKNTPFDHVHLLCNYKSIEISQYIDWLKNQLDTRTVVSHYRVSLSSPTAYEEIYPVAFEQLTLLDKKHPNHQKFIHLSPGTPAMTAVWVLLVKTQFPSVCLESWIDSEGQQVQQRELPFQISAEFSYKAQKRASYRLLTAEEAYPELTGVIGRSPAMLDAIKKAKKMAIRDVPVLIQGETGTGKEVFAKAIHDESSRKKKPFVAVNCAALPSNLAESLLFGHKKGAFTGSIGNHSGYFTQADEGTLFLDEIGDLDLQLQTKLLRALQEKEFTPVGGSAIEKSDFRLICATHRNLTEMIEKNSFREDLFYRIAIGIIHLPAVRDRLDDIDLLSDALLKQINQELADQPEYHKKSLSSSAYTYIKSHYWPGNVRELKACLLRAAVWTDGNLLSVDDISNSIIKRDTKPSPILNQLNSGIDLNNELGKIASDYIRQALQKTHGNKAATAKLLGFKSSQVLTNWITKYDIRDVSTPNE